MIRAAPARIGRLALAGVDRTLAILTHAGIGFGLFGIGWVISLVITGVVWLRSRHSPDLHRESEQAGMYQLLVFLINIVFGGLWVVAFVWLLSQIPAAGPQNAGGWILIAFGLLLLLIPAFAVWYFGTIAYGLVTALQVAAGRPSRYAIIGGWVDRRLAQSGRFPSTPRPFYDSMSETDDGVERSHRPDSQPDDGRRPGREPGDPGRP